MRWQKIVIEELENHQSKINSLDNIKTKLQNLENKKSSLKGANYDATPCTGSGGTHWEDNLINTIIEIDKLKETYKRNKKDVDRIAGALKKLDSQDYEIIEGFYIKKRKSYATEAAKKLQYDKSHIYNLKDNALRKLTLELYGREEI